MPGGWHLSGWELSPGVPSVVYMAAVHWLEKIIQQEEIDKLIRLHEATRQLLPDYGEWGTDIACISKAYQQRGGILKRLASLDGSVFFEHILDMYSEAQAEIMRKALNDLATQERPTPFYAILLMDGDSLGSHLGNPAKQPMISGALERFTQGVGDIVYQHNGFLIYAGGDDVLAMLPLEDALDCAAALQKAYLKAFKDPDNLFTLSGAIEFAHVKMPLTRILKDAHDLLDNVAKDGRGRDAVAVRVWKPGGKALEWAMPWTKAVSNGKLILTELAAAFRKEQERQLQFSSKFFYKIEERFEILNPPPKEKKPLLLEDQACKLLAVDYLASGINEGRQPKLKLTDAEKSIQPLLTQCRPVVREVKEEKIEFKVSKRLNVDGALLVRFLVQIRSGTAMNNAKLWHFEALDSWFFRESRPHGTVGGSELASVFPPPARILAGAVRTLIGETQGVNWEQYPAGYPDLEQQIGNADSLGKLQLRGPYLLKDGQRLYPVLLHLLGKSIPAANGTDADDEKWEFICLRPGDPVECDLGKVQLPALEQPLPGAKPLESVWLDGANLALVLKGEKPQRLYRKRELLVEEPRLGIARHYDRRTVEESLLYQTRHIRLREGVALGVMVGGIDPAFHPAGGLLRCGGEGRLGVVTVLEPPQGSQIDPLQPAANKLLLVLLTHADFGGDWLPPGFKAEPDLKAEKKNGIRIWKGWIDNTELTIQAAAVGKLVREGGWDLSKQQPRSVIGLVPAGSAYFCTVDGDLQTAVTALHGKSIGNNTELGRGELAVGLW